MSVRSKLSREVEAPVESERDVCKLPEGWAWSTVGEATINFDGRRIPLKSADRDIRSGPYPYYGASGIIDDIDDYLFDGEFLLIAEDGANLLSRSTPIAFRATGKFWVNNHVHVVQPISVALLGFIEHYLNSIDLSFHVTGSAQPKLTQAALNQIRVPIAPLAEQHRIAGKLELLLAKVSSSQQRLSRVPGLLKRFRQSVLAAACSGKLTADWREENEDVETAIELLDRLQAERRKSWSISHPNRKYQEPDKLEDDDLEAIPESWLWTNFDHCASEITVGHVGPMKDRYVDSGVAFLRSQNVRPLRFDPLGLVRIPKDFQAELTKSRLVGGEILVVRSGANTGDCCVFPRGMEAANCADLVITRPLTGLCAEYGAMYVASPIGQAAIGLRQTGIAQPHFNIGAMRVKPFPLPPLSEQQEIVRRVEKLLAFADQIEARLKQAQSHVDRLTQSLLAKAFRGELVSTEHTLATAAGRDYESATELLARIQLQNPRSPSPGRDKSSKTSPVVEKSKRLPASKK